MSTVSEQYAPGTAVEGCYLGQADYTGRVIDNWPHPDKPFTTVVSVRTDEPIITHDGPLAFVNKVVIEFVKPDGSCLDGSTLATREDVTA